MGDRRYSPAGKVVKNTNVGTGSSGLSEAHVAGSADRPKGAVPTVLGQVRGPDPARVIALHL